MAIGRLIARNQSDGIDLEAITRGLAHLSQTTIQTLWAAGDSGNFKTKNIDEWLVRLQNIRPRTVQRYTLDRGYSDKRLKRVSRMALSQIKHQLCAIGLNAEIF